MKNKAIIFLFLALFFSASCTSNDTQKIRLLTSFLKDAVNPAVTNNKLVDDYMCKASSPLNANLRMLILSPVFNIFRKDLAAQPDDIKNNFQASLKSYKSLPSDVQNVILNPGDEDNVFCFSGAKNLSFLILVRNGKVISFTLIPKGAQRVFVDTCN